MTAGGCLGRSFPTCPRQAGAALPPASLQASLSLARLCRYVRRPAVSEKRMALTPNGKIRYPLKTSCRDGTTHVLFEPLDFTARLAALAPKPGVRLTRFHGVFAANGKHRIQVTPGKRGKGRGQAKIATRNWLEKTSQERHRAMTWMQRLKRVFGIDIETCERCGAKVKVIASIEAPAVIAYSKTLETEGSLENRHSTARTSAPGDEAVRLTFLK